MHVRDDPQQILAGDVALALLHAARALRVKLAPAFVRTSEGNRPDIEMLEEFVTDLAAGADDHVEHTGGSARLLENPNHSCACEWRERGGLEYNGISSD